MAGPAAGGSDGADGAIGGSAPAAKSARQVDELLASASGIEAPKGLADRIANFVLRKPPNKPDKS